MNTQGATTRLGLHCIFHPLDCLPASGVTFTHALKLVLIARAELRLMPQDVAGFVALDAGAVTLRRVLIPIDQVPRTWERACAVGHEPAALAEK